MCDCDSNPPSFFRQLTRKAHRCDECRRTIEAGEHYEYISGCWDGGVMVFMVCAHCWAAGQTVKEIDPDACFCLGEQWSGIEDSTGSRRERGKVINRLIASARRQWTYRRGPRAGQLMPVPVMPAAALSEGATTDV